MAASLHALVGAGLPVLTVAAPPNPCNARHRGVATVAAALASRRFIGVQLVTGSHADVLGASVGALERRVCGTPAPGNIEAAQALAVGWLGDVLAAGDDRAEGDVADDGSGSSSPSDFEPHGATYQALLGAGVIAPLG